MLLLRDQMSDLTTYLYCIIQSKLKRYRQIINYYNGPVIYNVDLVPFPNAGIILDFSKLEGNVSSLKERLIKGFMGYKITLAQTLSKKYFLLSYGVIDF